jgi:hypothetical protein
VFDKKMSHNLHSQLGQSENGVAVEFLLLIVFTKTFTENWDSKRHLLELSWSI